MKTLFTGGTKKGGRSLPAQIKQRIEAVSMDGSRTYRRAVESELPHAKICLDRFHPY